MPHATIAPRIYVGSGASPPMSVTARVVAGVVSLACLAVLLTAAWLRPDASGLGTHRQLGLAPCTLLQQTGVPCPTCGMTTSFANAAHGRLLDSLRGQPAGTVLYGIAAAAVWVGGYVAATGRPGAAIVRRLPITAALLTLLGVVLAGWAYAVVAVLSRAASS